MVTPWVTQVCGLSGMPCLDFPPPLLPDKWHGSRDPGQKVSLFTRVLSDIKSDLKDCMQVLKSSVISLCPGLTTEQTVVICSPLHVAVCWQCDNIPCGEEGQGAGQGARYLHSYVPRDLPWLCHCEGTRMWTGCPVGQTLGLWFQLYKWRRTKYCFVFNGRGSLRWDHLY